jgi:hypothetical protein
MSRRTIIKLFSILTHIGGGGDMVVFFFVCFFGGGGGANTKIVPIFESVKKPYKEPPPTVCKINIIDFDNLARRLP